MKITSRCYHCYCESNFHHPNDEICLNTADLYTKELGPVCIECFDHYKSGPYPLTMMEELS